MATDNDTNPNPKVASGTGVVISPPTKMLPGADVNAAPGQSPDSVAKTAGEPSKMEHAAGERAQHDAQSAADKAAADARKGVIAAPVVADIPDEQAAVAEFAKKHDLSGAESGLLRAILQARRDGTTVPSVAYNNIPDDRVAAVAEASDAYVKARQKG